MSHDRNGRNPTAPKTAEPAPVVYVIDDDLDVREALKSLLGSVGLESLAFGSTEEFLPSRDTVSCLVLDIRLPGGSGLDFPARLARAGIVIPVIFLTGHGDIRMSVSAMKAGAVEFLTKPFREQELLDAVQKALDRDRARRERIAQLQAVKARYDSLTEREREILRLVTSGRLNKQIAHDAGLSEVTVKVHRAKLMRKLQVRNLPALVKVADALGVG